MNASLWLATVCVCAQFGGMVIPAAPNPPENRAAAAVPASSSAASRIVAVTVYQGQALVTREAAIPEGAGTMELVVSPLPPQTVESSLYTEGAEGLRVLSTRYRTRSVKADLRREVREKEDLLKKLQGESRTLHDESAVHALDLQFLQKLEGFTNFSLANLTKEGRLDSPSVLALSKFIMQTREEKSKSETELRQRIQASTEAAEFAKRQLAELSGGPGRTEREAIIVVSKSRPAAGTVRLSYLVTGAGWLPQYRLRGGADKDPVRIEYLAAVTQQTGEDWPDVRATLSTSRPSLDAGPPELLPLTMAVAEPGKTGPVAGDDERSRKVEAELANVADLSFPTETPLEDVLKSIRDRTKTAAFPEGIPVYVDPMGLQETDKTMTSPVVFDAKGIPLRTSLSVMLKQLGLTYRVKDGLLMITSQESDDQVNQDRPDQFLTMGGMGGGMRGGGFGGMGMSLEQAQAAGRNMLNQVAAIGQSREFRVAEGKTAAEGESVGDEMPSLTFSITAPLNIPSRPDPQLLEVARIEVPAEYYAKATPVLTPRVYRLAKLTNQSDTVLLPGEATVYVGSDYVGRMRLPLVAAGEPFLVGFGVDPQIQVSRRLVQKSRSVQGGNQLFNYEFRIGLRNYHKGSVKVQLWDRLPKPQGEAVAVNLVKTSQELSTDPLYLRTGRLDNLLRWDLTVPEGTVGDKALYVNYELRLEYARDLPPPRFISGGLGEAPIGGGAMGTGGMGGGMGGMRSVKPLGR